MPPYVLYGVKYVDLVSLAVFPGAPKLQQPQLQLAGVWLWHAHRDGLHPVVITTLFTVPTYGYGMRTKMEARAP